MTAQMLSKPNPTLFNIAYTRTYNIGPFARSYLLTGQPALARRIQETYASRPREGLWISFFSNTRAFKRVVRSHATRTLKTAFRKALATRGYGPEGRSLDGTRKKDLRGSLVLYPSAWMEILVRSDLLDCEMLDTVSWLESQQGGVTGKRVLGLGGDGA